RRKSAAGRVRVPAVPACRFARRRPWLHRKLPARPRRRPRSACRTTTGRAAVRPRRRRHPGPHGGWWRSCPSNPARRGTKREQLSPIVKPRGRIRPNVGQAPRPLWRKFIIDPAASRPVTEQRHIRRLMLFFAIVYAVEGIGQGRFGIIFQPVSYYLKINGWSPVEVTAYFAVLNFPWVIKPAFGLVSDLVPLFGYRRKSYLILSSLCAIGAFAWISRLTTPGGMALPLLVTAYAMATSSTLCGALLAENGREIHQGSLLVGQQWLWFNIAIMASSYAGGALIEALPPLLAVQVAAGVAALAPIAVIVGSLFLIDERRGTVSRAELQRTLASIVEALKSGKLYLLAL